MLGELDPLAPGDGVAAAGARRAYWLTVLLGSGTLAPWNAWLLAYRYFDTVFGQERDVQYVFTACYYAPTALVILLMLRPSRLMGRLSTRARIVIAYSVNVVLLLLVPLFVAMGTFSWDARGGRTHEPPPTLSDASDRDPRTRHEAPPAPSPPAPRFLTPPTSERTPRPLATRLTIMSRDDWLKDRDETTTLAMSPLSMKL